MSPTGTATRRRGERSTTTVPGCASLVILITASDNEAALLAVTFKPDPRR